MSITSRLSLQQTAFTLVYLLQPNLLQQHGQTECVKSLLPTHWGSPSGPGCTNAGCFWVLRLLSQCLTAQPFLFLVLAQAVPCVAYRQAGGCHEGHGGDCGQGSGQGPAEPDRQDCKHLHHPLVRTGLLYLYCSSASSYADSAV